MREAPVYLGDRTHVGHDGAIGAPGDEFLHLLQQGGKFRRLHVGVDGHTQLGAAGMSDGNRFVQLPIGEFVGVATAAPAACPDINRIGATLDYCLRHLQISRRCQ
jgi:hypothetical protein